MQEIFRVAFKQYCSRAVKQLLFFLGKTAFNHSLKLAFLFCFVLNITTAFSQEYYFTHYNESFNNFYSDDVYKLVQDSDGYIWLPVYSRGLIRYDGKNYERFSVQHGIKNTRILNLFEDLDKHLWVIADNGLYRSRVKTVQINVNDTLAFLDQINNTQLTKESISQVAPNSITSTSSRQIFVSTNEGNVYEYRYHGATVIEEKKWSFPNISLLAVFADNSNTIWLSTNKGLYTKSPQDTIFLQTKVNSLSPISFYQHQNNDLWLGFDDGSVARLINAQIQHVTPALESDGSSVYHIGEAAQGMVAVSRHGNGLYVLDSAGTQQFHFSRSNGLIEDNVRSSFLDRENNLWITTSGGISKLPPSFKEFTYLTGETSAYKLPSLIDPSINGVSINKKKKHIWIAAHKGISVFDSLYHSQHINVSDGLANNVNYDVFVDEKERVWAGNFNGINCIYPIHLRPASLGKKSERPITVFNEKLKIAFFEAGITGAIESMNINGSEMLGFVSYDQIVLYFNEEWYIFSIKAGVPNGIVFSMTLDSKNNLYISSGTKGVLKTRVPISSTWFKTLNVDQNRVVQDSSFYIIPELNLTPYSEIIAFNNKLFLSADHSVEIAELSTYKSIKSFPFTNVYSGSYAKNLNRIWFNTENDIVELNTTTLKTERMLNTSSGLMSNSVTWLQGINFSPTGKLYIGTRKGLHIYNTQTENHFSAEPLGAIRLSEFSEDLFGNNIASFSFASLNFTDEKSNQFKYKLDGFDKEYSQASTDHIVRYTNLTAYLFPKRYTINVLVSNSQNQWAKTPKSTSILVSPPLWFRWWFLPLYLFFFFYLNKALLWIVQNWRFLISPRTKYIGKYKVLSTLGLGNMSRVYEAYDPDKKAVIAIKVVEVEEETADDAFRMFIKEAELGKQLKHHNLVRIFDAGTAQDLRYLSMEKVTGCTLKQAIKRNLLKSELDQAFVVHELLEGLEHLSSMSVVHRDLKSSNIMVDIERRIVKIMDFGLSSARQLISLNDRTNVVGTLAYMSPEQTIGKNVDHRSDIYSFGVVLYELLFSDLPHLAANEMELIFSIHNETPEQFIISKHPWLNIVKQCMAKNPDDRFQSVQELKFAFRSAKEKTYTI